MRKVLIYRSDLLPYSETFVLEQLRSLSRWHGMLLGERRLDKSIDLSGIDSFLLPGTNNPPAHLLTRTWHWTFDSLAPWVKRGLGKFHPSLIHVHFGTDAVRAHRVARALSLPMVVTLHGYDINTDFSWWQSGLAGRRMRRYPERLHRLFRDPSVFFIAVSKAIRDRAIELGTPPERLTVLHVGIDSDRFKPTGTSAGSRTARVLFVGRLVEKKGCEYLIQAMSIVAKELPASELVICGDGPLRNPLEQLARSLRLRITFLGAVNTAIVQSEMAKARVLCLPSVTATNGDAEGFGMVLLEAQASGVPVVTSARGGATEGILEGKTGLSFRERDVGTLAVYLQQLLQNQQQADVFGMAGPPFIRQFFDVKSLTHLLENFYDDVVRATPRNG